MARENNKKNLLIILIVIIIVLIMITLTIITKINRSMPSNPLGTVGNTSGNLNNNGLFCEDGSKIYFSNPYDNNYLYSMNPDGSDAELLMEVPSKFINSAGDYLYFNQMDSDVGTIFGLAGNMHGVYRKKKTGSKEYICLDRAVVGYVVLVNDTVYYQYADKDETSFKYVTTDNKNSELIEKSYVNPSCVINNNIYYPDYNNNHLLAEYNTSTGQSNIFLNVRVHNPTYSNGYIYYMSVDDDYHLYRYSLSDNSTQQLTEDRLDCFNVLGDTVFYQKNDKEAPMLIRMNADGSGKTAIAEGNFTNINMTTYYTYFQDYLDKSRLYRVTTSAAGDTSVSEFIP
ncbi:MAG: DUF5050 domain-containing protein [Lachnospiraceae bacterium]|nr:DUF5050 domain-containing protein [Lachnospiraceae bacterium]